MRQRVPLADRARSRIATIGRRYDRGRAKAEGWETLGVMRDCHQV